MAMFVSFEEELVCDGGNIEVDKENGDTEPQEKTDILDCDELLAYGETAEVKTPTARTHTHLLIRLWNERLSLIHVAIDINPSIPSTPSTWRALIQIHKGHTRHRGTVGASRGDGVADQITTARERL
eukprot:CAMPEP_0175985276 /NCGR_PEP_ID=MMETSP0108-20121206/49472_1 /TAXON_ID=195067 ORGANISM="Goniomonas pacifica, Strain CCMP1869" /NCGR_SAMPLE_ID=MMETSP0108 /ASSEMBLY_ACC=CAM_ASM_000204 /LENGTH=126 /DNA_ID=CAMNT_0017316241 /DNA_START=622 /DNA_END=999 /DNA_ORIENTATION=-